MITIFTPAYNRARLLPRLYQSLCRQTRKDFEWLIVDDGSTDDTEAVCRQFTGEGFPVRYFRKENGGKQRAINYAVSRAEGEWFIILDSDDYLTDNAVELVLPHLAAIRDDASFAGVMGVERSTTGVISGGERTYTTLDTDMLSFRTRYGISAESTEVLRTSVMREFPFPEFEGEKFVQEAVVWNRIARRYKCRYINEVLQIQEYLPGGLTRTADELMRRNPCGALLYYRESFTYGNTLPYRYWALGEYWRYYKHCPRRTEEPFRPTRPLRLLRPLAWTYGIVRALRRRLMSRG
ncbi:MAG: glycosyltransferase family 2 protein [Alloprevotella sp.]|nr:glycosyltransferase family 2 protein [Alloprevotella sp.]